MSVFFNLVIPVIPVHYESLGLGQGAIVGDSPEQYAKRSTNNVIIIPDVLPAYSVFEINLADVSQAETPLNDRGEPYPKVTDPRTKKPIPFPEDAEWTPKDQREPRIPDYREDYMKEWEKRGFPEPDGGWKEHQIHHQKPLEYGGDNSFENCVPLKKPDHGSFTRWWRGGYKKPR